MGVSGKSPGRFHSGCRPKTDDSGENIKNFGKITKRAKSTRRDSREVVKLITHDTIRVINIPRETHITPKVFDVDLFNSLKEKAKYLTPQERLQATHRAKEQKNQEMTECANRKKELQSFDVAREHGLRLSELEEEAERRNNHLLARAYELRQEQEDEIKKCNTLILSTKCHAIRDAQVAEKALIKRELEEEDKRLEEMMEQERLRALREQARKQEKEVSNKHNYTSSLMAQVKENELQREIAAEAIEEEARLANEAAMQVQLDELQAAKEKQVERERLRQEMNAVNEQLKRLAAIEREENRLADLKVERQWRKKEREAVIRRQKESEELREARMRQVENRRLCQAIEIQREKEEAEKIARFNEDAMKREKEDTIKKKCAIDRYRIQLLKQINEKQENTIAARQAQFQEGVAIKMDEKKRNEMLKDTMLRKMQQIRSHRVPEKYVREVERQLKITE
ncbi:cilia- and flagella-associated protein 45 [Nilaparvata lugens]|uniref:cilia- and flagella-associated protein 45 n=1 Tax=Nilaparvata lugens TaxID=108931 RepID=UPI00193E984A|nr:cilia- and flagella-associated protein 45 [Nilaparvata lugens]